MVVCHPSELNSVTDIGLHGKGNEAKNALRRCNDDVLCSWRWSSIVSVVVVVGVVVTDVGRIFVVVVARIVATRNIATSVIITGSANTTATTINSIVLVSVRVAVCV